MGELYSVEPENPNLSGLCPGCPVWVLPIFTSSFLLFSFLFPQICGG